jgi:hypothetical protein
MVQYPMAYFSSTMPESTSQRVHQLRQLTSITRDDELLSPADRDVLWKAGLVSRMHGWNMVTEHGIDYLMSLGLLEHGFVGERGTRKERS